MRKRHSLRETHQYDVWWWSSDRGADERIVAALRANGVLAKHSSTIQGRVGYRLLSGVKKSVLLRRINAAISGNLRKGTPKWQLQRPHEDFGLNIREL